MKVHGKVIRQSSHLAYGYGGRTYRCGNCGEEHRRFYNVPPKAVTKGYPNPATGILKVNFKDGVSGFAASVVLTAKSSAPAAEMPNPEVEPAAAGQAVES